ncbi:hypothetical protein EI94DRAFT_1715381 [Lactarius quietus]|nr:hypothetical protein EI94DRAFT_1715381 [Lactarius quietus]
MSTLGVIKESTVEVLRLCEGQQATADIYRQFTNMEKMCSSTAFVKPLSSCICRSRNKSSKCLNNVRAYEHGRSVTSWHDVFCFAPSSAPLSATCSHTTVTATTKIWCLLINHANELDGEPFPVEVSSTGNVHDLKVGVKLRNKRTLDDIPANHLVVWKCEDRKVTPTTRPKELAKLLKDIDFQDEDKALIVAEKVTSDFDGQIFVVRKMGDIKASSSCKQNLEHLERAIVGLYPRKDTVAAIWERLREYRLVWARGTPGSGKTALSNLLAVHIQSQLPSVKVIRLDGWPDKLLYERWSAHLENMGWEGMHSKAVLIFDEGQDTYKEEILWTEFFKPVGSRDYPKTYAIVFASYGSATSPFEIFTGSWIHIPPMMRIGLRAIDHGDRLPAAGILFTKEEFDSYVDQISGKEGPIFRRSIFHHLFELTGGHIRAIVDVKRLAECSDECRSRTRTYDWDAFERSFTPGELVDLLQNTTIFGRGLPAVQYLQDPQTVNALSIVAQKSRVLMMEVTEDIRERLIFCAQKGWLSSDASNKNGAVCYFFASKLHQWCVQWKLFLDNRWAGNVEEDNIVDFAKKVLQRFDPRALTGQREVNDSGAVQRTPEAQYQDEFYRCCHNLSGGSAIVFPEFGTKRGRVDFYVKSRKWAIELVCDGAQLQEHVGRFRNPLRYAELPIDEFLVLNCCTSRPESPHPDLENLVYHAVFTDDYNSVEIFDCELNLEENFRLVKH